MRLVTERKEVEPMSRPALASLPLVEAVESHDRLLDRIGSDGVITMDEFRQVVRSFKAINRKANRIHTGFGFMQMLLIGDGIDGEWVNRKWKEYQKDRTHLRIMPEDDRPDPAGPAQAKAA
jgi:hypothetical protein